MKKDINISQTDNGMILVQWYEDEVSEKMFCGTDHTYAFADLVSALSFVESKFAPTT